MTLASSPARADVLATVVDAVVAILPAVPRHDVVGTRHLRHLGADSVDRVEIIALALDRLAIQETLASFSDLRDIDAMVDLLHARSRR